MPTIIPKDDQDRERLRVELLEAAGDQPQRVQYDTTGPTLAFRVDDELAAAVGAGVHVDPDTDLGAQDATEVQDGAAADAAAQAEATDHAASDGDPVPVTAPEDIPARNAATDVWAEFVARYPITVTAEDPEDVKRAEYIAAWDAYATDHGIRQD